MSTLFLPFNHFIDSTIYHFILSFRFFFHFSDYFFLVESVDQGKKSYQILMNVDESNINFKSINGNDFSANKFRIKSKATKLFKFFVEILLSILLVLIFICVMLIVVYKDSFLNWAKH